IMERRVVGTLAIGAAAIPISLAISWPLIALTIMRRGEADDAPVAGIDHEPPVLTVPVDHRNRVNKPTLRGNAERRETVVAQDRIASAGRNQARPAAILAITVNRRRRRRHRAIRPLIRWLDDRALKIRPLEVGTLEIGNGPVGRQHLSMGY